MKGAIFLLFIITLSHADPRGKPYQRDKVCQEFNMLGKEKFFTLAVIMNSRKYSNATFEEIGHIVNAIVLLAETCCAKGASADCYDNGASALSERSCDPTSPFPKHPGVTKCCVHKGLERRLCLADLKQPPKEFPTYLEPSDEELCTAFKTNPQLFSMKFLHDYSSNYAQAPFLVITDSTAKYLNMINECCTARKPTPCFLKQRLQRHQQHLLTVMSNRMCSRFASYGEENLKFSAAIMFGQKIPSAEFKDIMAIVEQGTQLLSKCCGSLTENCFENELTTHIQQACKKLSIDVKAAECCKKPAVDALHCLHSMPAAEGIKLPNFQLPTGDQLCKKGKNQETEKFMYELARRNTKLPEAFIDKLYESVKDVVNKCCLAENANSCLQKKKSQLTEAIKTYISESNALCGDYNKYPFTEFKERLIKDLSKKPSKLSSSNVKEVAEERADLASTCCVINAPPVYCKEKINKIIRCAQEPCLV